MGGGEGRWERLESVGEGKGRGMEEVTGLTLETYISLNTSPAKTSSLNTSPHAHHTLSLKLTAPSHPFHTFDLPPLYSSLRYKRP